MGDPAGQAPAAGTGPTRLAVVDPAYVSGLPRVTFDGDTTMSTKGYAYLAGYEPIAEDRVLMVAAGLNNWVIVDSVVA